jgi:hypothetical protein
MDKCLAYEGKETGKDLDEEIIRLEKYLEKQINALQVQLAEIRGQVSQINQRERGPAGPRGERGVKGPRGRQGRKGDPALTPKTATIKRWVIDRARFTATPVMSDHTCGSSIELLGLFKQYNEQTTT